MEITKAVINDFFGNLTAMPEINVMSEDGFRTLAGWCERQQWWTDFAALHSLQADWRFSAMGDPYLFALAMFRFQMGLRGWGD